MPRPPHAHAWYCTTSWLRRRRHQLRVEPLCRICLEAGHPTAATVADHIVPHKGDYAAFRLGELRHMNQRGAPILSGGLKVQQWNVPARDAQIAELLRMSAEKICWCFGVPLQLLGLGATPSGTTEQLIELWLKTALQFALNHVEEGFDHLFDLSGWPESYTEFDTAALLRASQGDRIEALARATQTGIFSPNEARAFEDLPPVPFGDEPRTQAQNVPLSAAADIPSMPAAAVPPTAPAAMKDHQEAVRRELADIRARAANAANLGYETMRRTKQPAEPREHVVRKTKLNGRDQRR